MAFLTWNILLIAVLRASLPPSVNARIAACGGHNPQGRKEQQEQRNVTLAGMHACVKCYCTENTYTENDLLRKILLS